MTHITDHKTIHLIGIGGCSMNGLAQILRDRGYAVQGSDANVSRLTISVRPTSSFILRRLSQRT